MNKLILYDCPRCFGSGSEIESPEGTTCQRYIMCDTCNGTGTTSLNYDAGFDECRKGAK